MQSDQTDDDQLLLSFFVLLPFLLLLLLLQYFIDDSIIMYYYILFIIIIIMRISSCSISIVGDLFVILIFVPNIKTKHHNDSSLSSLPMRLDNEG